jgi:hypothetical protein
VKPIESLAAWTGLAAGDRIICFSIAASRGRRFVIPHSVGTYRAPGMKLRLYCGCESLPDRSEFCSFFRLTEEKGTRKAQILISG